MRRAVVHIRRQPYMVTHLLSAQKAQQFGNLQLAALGRARVAVGNRLPARHTGADLTIRHTQADGHVGRDDFPLRLGRLEFALEPVQLLATDEGFCAAQVVIVGAAIAAHVQHEHIQQRAVAELAIDPPATVGALPAHR